MKRVKKVCSIVILLTIALMINAVSYAAIDSTIHFEVNYEGTIKANEQKATAIVLAGENTPLHSNVRVKVDIEGPSKPKLLATDSLGTEIDIADWGYWGPEAGFPIQGTFRNETPVKATFSQEGTYTITLSLLDVQNNNDVLAQKAVTFQVQSDTPPVANVTINETVNEMVNEPMPELPKTGTSMVEYAIYLIGVCAVIYVVYQVRVRRG